MYHNYRKTLYQAAMAGAVLAGASSARAQIATLDKGHSLLVSDGLQIWGADTDNSYPFDYNTMAAANLNAVFWGFGGTPTTNMSALSPGDKWGKAVDPSSDPTTVLTADENAHKSDLVALQVGDEQDLSNNPNGSSFTQTVSWFQNAQSNNTFANQLLYVNQDTIFSDANFASFIGQANPDAISFDSYPFSNPDGYYISPDNWLAKAQQFRRHALGSYIGATGNAPRPYGLFLQTYHDTFAVDPGDVQMRWQQFVAWTMGYTFSDAFIYDGGNTNFYTQGTLYNQFKETARQSRNIGPALTKLISYSNGVAGGGTSIVLGKNASGSTNSVPASWQVFSATDAPPSQRYMQSLVATNLGTKNGGFAGDIYIGFFNPLQVSYGDPAGTAYFMVTNGLGGDLVLPNGSADNTALATDCQQQITVKFDFGTSGITSLQRLRRSDGQLEVVPLTQVTGNQYKLVFTLDGGTGDLFKFNDSTPFVGAPAVAAMYWDNDGSASGNNTSTGANMGGAGTWDSASSKWFNGSANGTWTTGRDAIFWGTAGTVTLASPQSANGLNFKTDGYVLSGSTLTLTAGTVSADANVTATIGSAVAGVAGLVKNGAGTLKLTGTNTYTGGTVISAGVLQVSADNSLGGVPASLTSNILLNGGTLQWGGNFDLSNTRGITLGPAGGTVDTQSFSNPGGYNATAGGFQGSGNLTKIGSGTFFAAATSGGLDTTWKGNLIIKQGTWKIVASDGLPYNVPAADGLKAAQVTLDGGTWQFGAAINVTNGLRGITVAAGGGTIDTQNFNVTWAGPITGAGSLTKIGSGTLRLDSATFAGSMSGTLNINGGLVDLDFGQALGSLASVNLANVAGVALAISGTNTQQDRDTQTIGSLSGGGSLGGNVTLVNYLDTGGNNATTTFGGVISGLGDLVKSGGGTMRLTGANTYVGGTIFAGGVLAVDSSPNLGNASSSNGLFFRGGTLQLLGSFSTTRQLDILAAGGAIDATGNALAFTSAAQSITWGGNLTLAGGTLTLGSNAPAAVTNGVTLTIQSGATLNLSGANSQLADGNGNYVNVLNNSATGLNIPGPTQQQMGNIDGSGQTSVPTGGLLFANYIRQNTLTLNGRAVVRQNTTPTTSNIKTLTLGAQAQLALSNNKLITQSDIGSWNGTAYTGVTGLIQTGRNGGSWDGPGLVGTNTSFSQGLTGLAVAANAGLGKTTFGGMSVGPADVLVMCTYVGDADLNGRIDADDYFSIDKGYASHSSGYVNGDFNYDGRVDGDDYFIIDSNYVRQSTPFPDAAPLGDSTGMTAVPEPAGIALLGITGMAIGRRRRRPT